MLLKDKIINLLFRRTKGSKPLTDNKPLTDRSIIPITCPEHHTCEVGINNSSSNHNIDLKNITPEQCIWFKNGFCYKEIPAPW